MEPSKESKNQEVIEMEGAAAAAPFFQFQVFRTGKLILQGETITLI